MSGLLAYSGIATKVKSMQSKLLSEDKLREMADSPGCRTSYLTNLLQKGDKKTLTSWEMLPF